MSRYIEHGNEIFGSVSIFVRGHCASSDLTGKNMQNDARRAVSLPPTVMLLDASMETSKQTTQSDLGVQPSGKSQTENQKEERGKKGKQKGSANEGGQSGGGSREKDDQVVKKENKEGFVHSTETRKDKSKVGSPSIASNKNDKKLNTGNDKADSIDQTSNTEGETSKTNEYIDQSKEELPKSGKSGNNQNGKNQKGWRNNKNKQQEETAEAETSTKPDADTTKANENMQEPATYDTKKKVTIVEQEHSVTGTKSHGDDNKKEDAVGETWTQNENMSTFGEWFDTPANSDVNDGKTQW